MANKRVQSYTEECRTDAFRRAAWNFIAILV